MVLSIYQNETMKKLINTFILTVLLVTNSCTKQPNLGNGYKLISDKNYSLQIVNSENTIMVSMHILEYAFDSTFIIASQRPWDIPEFTGIKEMTYKKRNETFKNSSFCQYWIINKKEKCEYSLDSLTQDVRYSNVYGPYNKDDYLKKRKELNVSQKLILKEK